MEGGIGPENWFPPRRRVWREEKFERENGKDPERRLFERFSSLSLLGFEAALTFSDKVPDK